jgi:hypothetical protein
LVGALILAACGEEQGATGSSDDGGTRVAPLEGGTHTAPLEGIPASNPIAPVIILPPARDAGLSPPDAGASAPPDTPPVDMLTNDCQAPAGPGVEHSGTISADETWTAADSPHIVTFGLRVVGATLTIEACAIVRVMEGYTISVGGGNPGDPDAKLVAHGTSDGTSLRPVIVTSDDETKYWGTLQFNETATADLEHVVLHRAGNPATAQNLGGALLIFGDSNHKVPTRNVRAKSLLIDASASLGINIQRSGGFSEDSEDVVVRSSGNSSPSANSDTMYPVYVETPSIQTIPPGSYTGNVRDAIRVSNPSSLDGDETFHERGVPYRLRGALSIAPSKNAADGGLVTLTIDPGVTLELLKTPGNDWGITLGVSNGDLPENIRPTRLIAAGTAEKPIVITSAADVPAPGDWAGIEWRGGPPTGNVMSNVTVEYAGGRSGSIGFGCGPVSNDAALIIANWKPAEPFIQNCTFAHSLGGAIVSGWRSDSGPNLEPGNTFLDIASSCEVSQPMPTGGCPATELCY